MQQFVDFLDEFSYPSVFLLVFLFVVFDVVGFFVVFVELDVDILDDFLLGTDGLVFLPDDLFEMLVLDHKVLFLLNQSLHSFNQPFVLLLQFHYPPLQLPIPLQNLLHLNSW